PATRPARPFAPALPARLAQGGAQPTQDAPPPRAGAATPTPSSALATPWLRGALQALHGALAPDSLGGLVAWLCRLLSTPAGVPAGPETPGEHHATTRANHGYCLRHGLVHRVGRGGPGR